VNGMENYRRLLKRAVIIILLMLYVSSCDLLPLGRAEDKTTLEVKEVTIEATDVQVLALESSPTVFLTSTETLIPSPTKSPTKRPTWTPYPTKTLRPTWTPLPTITSTATREIGWMVKDDFSEQGENWLTDSGGNWMMGYTRGGYFLQVNQKNVEITSTPSWLRLTDVRIIVDVYRLNGKGYWGVSCRERPEGSYYTIFITNEGEYGYGETRNGVVTLNALGKSDEIHTQKLQVNQIMAECRGNHISLYVNGTMLFQVELVGVGNGWAGMMVGTTDERDLIEVVFDNIEIWGPLNE
jgi:hypothetical protein